MSVVREVQFTPPDADPDLITILEEWLERARSGEVIAIAIAGVRRGRSVSTQWHGATHSLHELISASTVLQYRILHKNLGDDDD